VYVNGKETAEVIDEQKVEEINEMYDLPSSTSYPATAIRLPELLAEPKEDEKEKEEEEAFDFNRKEEAPVEAYQEAKRKLSEKWSDTYTLESWLLSELGDDDSAGSCTAISIADLVWRQGSYPTLEDFEAISELALSEKSALAAWKLGIMVQIDRAVFK